MTCHSVSIGAASPYNNTSFSFFLCLVWFLSMSLYCFLKKKKKKTGKEKTRKKKCP
jgi:hypothetical protein